MNKSIKICILMILGLLAAGFSAIGDSDSIALSGDGTDYDALNESEEESAEYWKRSYYTILDDFEELENKYYNLLEDYDNFLDNERDELDFLDDCGRKFNGLLLEEGGDGASFGNPGDNHLINLTDVKNGIAYLYINGEKHSVGPYDEIKSGEHIFFIGEIYESFRDKIPSYIEVDFGNERNNARIYCYDEVIAKTLILVLGEGEGTTYNFGFQEITLGINLVNENGAVIKFNGREVVIREGDVIEIGNYYLRVRDLVDSTREGINGYVELQIMIDEYSYNKFYNDEIIVVEEEVEENSCNKLELKKSFKIHKGLELTTPSGNLSVEGIFDGGIVLSLDGKEIKIEVCKDSMVGPYKMRVHESFEGEEAKISYQKIPSSYCKSLEEQDCASEIACEPKYNQTKFLGLIPMKEFSVCILK